MFPDRQSTQFSRRRRCCRAWRACRCSPGGRCRATSRAGIPARIAGRASSSPSIASTSPATICGGSIGGPTAGPTGSTSRSSRPTRTCAAASCSTPAARWTSARRASPRSSTPGRIAGVAGLPGRAAGRRRRAVVRRQGHRAQHPAAAQSGPPDRPSSTSWNRLEPQGETQLVTVLHELAETIRQRALIVIISDLFVEPELLRGCFQHLRFRKHDVAAFHLLDPLELDFNFRRPMRFLDMEGGPADLRRAERDRRPLSTRRLQQYLDRSASKSCWNRPSTTTASASTRTTSRC